MGRGEAQCHVNAGEWEEDIETWWSQDPDTRPDLRQWLCVDKLAVCCPHDHYGPDCAPCSVKGDNGKVEQQRTVHRTFIEFIPFICLRSVVAMGSAREVGPEKAMESVNVIMSTQETFVTSAMKDITRASRMTPNYSAQLATSLALDTVQEVSSKLVNSLLTRLLF